MDIISALILGVVQGIAEFLPISSSGHLALVQKLMPTQIFGESSFNPSITFDIFLHVATLFAVVYVYFKDIKNLFTALVDSVRDIFSGKFKFNPEDENKKLLNMLVITTLFLIPAAFVTDMVEQAFSSLLVIGMMLFLTGVITFCTDFLTQGDVRAKNLTVKNACFVGFFQMLAVMPGLSRSGSSIFGGVLSGIKRDYAVKYSFLASIPAILAACFYQITQMAQGGIEFQILPYSVGGIVAFITGILSIGLVKQLAKKFKFRNFAYYCVVVSIVTLIIYFRG